MLIPEKFLTHFIRKKLTEKNLNFNALKTFDGLSFSKILVHFVCHGKYSASIATEFGL